MKRFAFTVFAGALAGIPSLVFGGGGVTNPEVEPNETKAAATLAASGGAGMASGDTLTGTTTGASTLPGTPSVDTFLIRTAAAPAGIYRHRVTLTTDGAAGHTGSIRGLVQISGNIQTATDIAFQTSSAATTPARFNQWYGFGQREEIFYRVTGTGATTQPYIATLTTEQVMPIVVSSPLMAGPITIARHAGAGNLNDIDMWLYTSDFNAVPLAGNDGQNTLIRNLGAGTYYLAVSNFNTANDQPSPPDDSFRNGNVLDLPAALANGSQTADLNLGMIFTDSGLSVTAAATKANAYDVAWFQFQVVTASNPTGTGMASPPTVGQDRSTLVTVTVIPGAVPPSTGIAVNLDAGSIGAGMMSLLDDGVPPDVTAGDNVFSGTLMIPMVAPLGPATLPFRVSDSQGRFTDGSVMITVTPPPPPNDVCSTAIVISSEMVGSPIPGTTTDSAVSTFDATGPCGGGQDTRDVFYSFEAPLTGFWGIDTCSTPGLDTVVSVHTACPTAQDIALLAGEACQDTTCGPANGGARVFAFLQSETTYIIRIATKDTATGDFTLVVNAPGAPPPNDECDAALEISADEIAFNNSGASSSAVPPADGCSFVAADVWFRWSPPTVIGNGLWQVAATAPGVRATLWPSDPCPTGGAAVACVAGGASATFEATANDTFLIQVGGTPATPIVGNASLLFSFIPNSGLCCVSGTLSVRTQQDCEQAGGTYQGDNTIGGFTGPGTMFAGQTNLPIPDNSTEGLSDTISVMEAGTVQNLVVNLTLDHAFIGDLSATISNGSVMAPLFARVGRVGSGFGSGSDFILDNPLRFFDTAAGDLWDTAAAGMAIPAGDYRPTAAGNSAASLAGFAGMPQAGDWTLTVTDVAGGNSGTLLAWSLEFNPPTDCPTVNPCPLDFNNDGELDPDDLADYITCFFAEAAAPGECPAAEFNDDGTFNADDLSDFITGFFIGC